MKVLVIGDSHGNIANLKHVMGFGKKIGACAVIHTGDWNNVASVEAVNSSEIPVYGVLGNADIDPLMANRLQTTAKKFSSNLLEFEVFGKKIAVTHKIHDIYKQKFNNWDIVFCGHYHSQIKSVYTRSNGDSFRVVRPGSLEKDINFAIYDTVTNEVEFVNEETLNV
jgi:putative phosphoesterase